MLIQFYKKDYSKNRRPIPYFQNDGKIYIFRKIPRSWNHGLPYARIIKVVRNNKGDKNYEMSINFTRKTERFEK